MGTVIIYDCLKRVRLPRVDALVTIGSPLGLDEIQDPLKPEWSRSNGFPSERVADRWLNVYDRIDVVALLDPKLANDYGVTTLGVVQDLNENNYGRWRTTSASISAARASGPSSPACSAWTGHDAANRRAGVGQAGGTGRRRLRPPEDDRAVRVADRAGPLHR